MKIFRKALSALMAILILFSCKEDDINSEDFNKNTDKSVNTNLDEAIGSETLKKLISSKEINTSLFITVKNESGININDVKVEVSGINNFTKEGIAIFDKTKVNEEFVVIKASKEGYFSALKTITLTNSLVNSYDIILFKSKPAKALNALEGGNLNFEEKVILNFPEDAIVDANNSPVNGNILVQLQYHDPLEETFSSSQPGTLVGLATGEELTALESFGMISVELTNNNGEQVFIKEGEQVEVTMPAHENSPQEIPLWHLNEEFGIWVETGKAIKEENQYKFKVSHFSSYNLDVKVDAVAKVTFKITLDGINLNNTLMEVLYEDRTLSNFINNTVIKIYTNDKGEFCLLRAPKGNYRLKISDLCKDLNHEEGVAVSDENTTIEVDFTSNNETIHKIQYEGEVLNCEGEPLPNQAFILDPENKNLPRITVRTNSEGKYIIKSQVFCLDDNTLTSFKFRSIRQEFNKAFIADITLSSLEKISENLVLCEKEVDSNSIGDSLKILSFPDKNLEYAIKKGLKIPLDNPITKDKIDEALSIITFKDRPIKDLSGIEFFNDLILLSLSLERNTKNFGLLKNINTRFLTIENALNQNQEEKIEIDVSLLPRKVKSLYFIGKIDLVNQFSLTELESFNYTIENGIDVDFSFLKTFPKLNSLTLGSFDSKIFNLDIVGELQNLEKLTLSFSRSNIESLDFLKKLENSLKEIRYSISSQTDLDLLTNHSKLKSVSIGLFKSSGNLILDLTPLFNKQELEILKIANNENVQIDLEQIKQFSKLKELSLNDNYTPEEKEEIINSLPNTDVIFSNF